MASIDFSETFIEDIAKVELASKRDEIFDRISVLEHMPEIGSKIISEYIRLQFGEGIRKLVVNSFDIVYEYYPECDLVYVEGLLHQRSIR